MLDIINGGIYSLNLTENKDKNLLEDFDYIGEHPMLIIRTLKEKDLYMIIPLTTYKPERWERCRKKGFGCRIESTNSIAKIDKITILSKNEIIQRWKDKVTRKFIILTPEELQKVRKRVEEYIALSNEKAKNEYQKYYAQYNMIFEECNNLFNKILLDRIIMKYKFTEDYLVCTYLLSQVNFLTADDVKNIFSYYFDTKNIKVVSNDICKILFINIKIVDKKVLTFKDNYDTLMLQKGK